MLTRAGSVFWTVAYDTLYAHQDKTDDAKLGLGSTALWDSSNVLPVSCSAAAAALWAGALAMHYHSPLAAFAAVPAGLFAMYISRVGACFCFAALSLSSHNSNVQMCPTEPRAVELFEGTCGSALCFSEVSALAAGRSWLLIPFPLGSFDGAPKCLDVDKQ